MRQGGMKPKSHSSGVYWVRANAANKKKTKHQMGDGETESPLPSFLDQDGDGHISLSEWAQFWAIVLGVLGLFIGLIILEFS